MASLQDFLSENTFNQLPRGRDDSAAKYVRHFRTAFEKGTNGSGEKPSEEQLGSFITQASIKAMASRGVVEKTVRRHMPELFSVATGEATRPAETNAADAPSAKRAPRPKPPAAPESPAAAPAPAPSVAVSSESHSLQQTKIHRFHPEVTAALGVTGIKTVEQLAGAFGEPDKKLALIMAWSYANQRETRNSDNYPFDTSMGRRVYTLPGFSDAYEKICKEKNVIPADPPEQNGKIMRSSPHRVVKEAMQARV